MLRYLILTGLVALLNAPCVALESGFSLIGADRQHGDTTETEWRLTDAQGQSIGLHHYRKPAVTPVASLLYLPGTNMNGVLKTNDPQNNLWLYLAERGVEVFTLDYRTRFVPHDYPGELAFMRDWTIERFVADAALAAGQVRAVRPTLPLFVAGFSRGAQYAYALAGQIDLAGLIILDGAFKSLPEKSVDIASMQREYDESGQFASMLSRRGHAARADLMQRVIDDPDGPARDSRYATSADNLAEVLHQAWGPARLSNTREGISSMQVLATEMLGYDWFFPSIQNIEGRAIASQRDAPGTHLDDHFGKLTLPIIYFGAGRMNPGWLIDGIHSASSAGTGPVDINVLESYGHLDVLFAKDAASEVYQPVAEWIQQCLKRSESGE